jgi:hypothetical protein
MRKSYNNFNKLEFLYAIKSMRKEAFKQSTIKSAFRKLGI